MSPCKKEMDDRNRNILRNIVERISRAVVSLDNVCLTMIVSDAGGMLAGVIITPSKKIYLNKRAPFLSRICMKNVKCRLEKDAENCLPDNSCEKGLATHSQTVCECLM